MTNPNSAAQAATQHPIDEAIVILTEEADSLSECHTLKPGDWEGEPEAKARYDHVQAVVAALSKLRAPVADERQSEIAAALQDSAYCAGLQRGFMLGNHNDNDGLRQALESRDGYVKTIKKARAALASAPVADASSDLPGMWDQSDLTGGETDCVPTSAPVAEDDEVRRIRGRGPAYPYTPNTAPPTPLASAPVAGEAQPFMYGIMGPDGKAHFEEFCVSGDRSELQAEVVDHLNRDHPEDGTYTVVALFRDAAPQASAEVQPNAEIVALAREGVRVNKPGTPEYLVCVELQRLARALKSQAAKDAAPCTCPSGDGSLRHPCAAHPAKASGNGGEKWSDS